jgi:ABC-type uncharacterized transport system involved in gliding motility auxiliary subunit
MPPRSARIWFEGTLFVLAVAAAILGTITATDEKTANTLYFVAWTAALLLLFSLALRLPLHPRGRYRGPALAGILVLACGIVLVGNIAMYRHDAHFDVTAEGRYTAPPQLVSVARSLDRDVAITYFYNGQDDDALRAKDVLAALARRYSHLQVRALDLDKEVIAARALGVRMYNSAIVASENRRTEIDNTVDLRDIAFAIERVRRERTPVACFMTGNGEPYGVPAHVHLGHQEVLGNGSTSTLEAPDTGVDRLQLAIEAIGYSDRAVFAPTAAEIPADCTVVVDLGPRNAYSADEVKLFARYLARGGRLLLMYDPEFPVAPALAALLGEVGLKVESGLVVDPLDHSGTEEDKVAVPYYPPHPITDEIALTVFPGPRPIRLIRRVRGIRATVLAETSKDSYIREAPGAVARVASVQTAGTPPKTEAGHGPFGLAVALEGPWPSRGDPDKGGRQPFRLVLVGSASFAVNGFFPYASNGPLAISMVRWLAGDIKAPKLQPRTYSLPEIRLTSAQMQTTFVVLEILLPLSVILLGVVVWRRRR